MEPKTDSSVLAKSQNDVARKKLEAELRAAEEIAKLRQSVIEKRLEVELASLENAPKTERKESSKNVQKPQPAPAPAEPRKLRPAKKTEPEIHRQTEEAATTSAYAGAKLQKSPFSLRFRREPRSPEKNIKSSVNVPSFLTFTRRHHVPEVFAPLRREEEDGDDSEDDETRPKRKVSFLKDVILKWKKKMMPEERGTERG